MLEQKAQDRSVIGAIAGAGATGIAAGAAARVLMPAAGKAAG